MRIMVLREGSGRLKHILTLFVVGLAGGCFTASVWARQMDVIGIRMAERRSEPIAFFTFSH